MAEEKNVKKEKKDRGRWFREMRSELKKVVWPTPEKVAKNTGTVILYTALIGACIWVFDGVAALFVKTLLDIFS
ncbi:MAG: preprotein translocase subunit SecE [Oscillospiraceae bacterium]|nr:preprotein translocase subunit SecE [Oscillospiraceae bacterium]